ncbi:MAG TPA: choice-of-anchor D domain-containing protein, partial [Kofleriaceae bacterium]|nr:choice-of-anchor D domain-containing protein [Kofleriaceae bacterium]
MMLGGLVLAGRAEADGSIAVDPNPITFWSQVTTYPGGMPGEAQGSAFFITNTGTTTLTVTGMTIVGPDASAMTFEFPPCEHTTSCPDTFTMAPGEQRGFALQCVAPAPGTFTASLVIADDATSGTSTVPMLCVGLHPPQLEISPPGLDFGTSHSCWFGDSCGPSCGTQPLTQTLTLTNAAPDPSVLDVMLALPPSAPWEGFTITVGGYPRGGEVRWELMAGQSVDVTFTFHPWFGRSQFFDGPLVIETRYPLASPVIHLPFHAYGGWGSVAIDTPPQLGIVPIGETLTATITMRNEGTSCLDLSEVTAWGDVRIISPLPADALIAAGETFQWTVACTPSPTMPGGSFEFYTPFEGNDSVRRYLFYCHSPTGALYATPPQVAFTGSAEVGVGMSGTQRLQVSNRGSEVTDLIAMTSSDARFTAALANGGLPITLAPYGEVAVDVTFTPTEVGHATATMLLHGTNGTDFTVAMAGDGVHLEAVVAPSAHDYGSIDVPGSQVQRFELSNLGERRLTIDAVTLDRPGDYHVDRLDAGAMIEPGGTVEFTVRAAPSLLGRRSATLAIDFDRARGLAIPLAAIGRDPAMTVTCGDATPDDYALE